MNCKEAHLLIAAISDDNFPAALAAHVESCSECSELMALDGKLRATLRSQEAVAPSSVRERIHAGISASPAEPWFGRFKKNTMMKFTIPALAASAIAIAFVAVPHSAEAATPLSTFNKMKKAVLAHTKQLTPVEIHVGKLKDGQVSGWVVFDGVLTELGPNGTFHKEQDGKSNSIQVSTLPGTQPDLSSLTPEQQKQVAQAIKDAMKDGKGGTHATTTYVVNGRPTDGATVKKLLRDNGVDLSLDIDLNADDYKSLKFGADHNHLVLAPKKSSAERYVLALDPKSNLPKSVLLERNEKGKWKNVKQSAVNLL